MAKTPQHPTFRAHARAALSDKALQQALGGLPGGLVARRAAAKAALPEFESLREHARGIRERTLGRLDQHLDTFAKAAEHAGSRVHWADDGKDACHIIEGILRSANARLVTKGKSMVTEEIGLNAHLQRAGMTVVETDLGEYLVQIRGETPSHIIAPAIHLTQADVEADFRKRHTHLSSSRKLERAEDLVAEARAVLRQKFLNAEAGITGANFLVAETGSAVIVTNEGNGDLTQSLPRIHIVVASIDKVVPTLEETAVLLRLLARSATGQEMTAYTTFATGPRRVNDPDGPEECHIVLVDNDRTALLGSEAREILRCIRCGACMNHCPVYNAVGGHTYASVYAGPMGAALTPALSGLAEHRDLPHASTLCGRCEDVCPVKIPLTKILRHWREEDVRQVTAPKGQMRWLMLWGFVAKRPKLYQALTRTMVHVLFGFGPRRGAFRRLPFGRGWTRTRDFPVPQGKTFQELWAERRKAGGAS